jgi:tetratricopeptide (TPR) repeat protein
LVATHDEPSLVLKQYLNQSHIKFSKRYYSQGLKNYQEGNYQDAIKKFDDALEKASNLAEAYSYRGKAKAEMGDTEGAISDYSQLLLIQPKNAEAYQHRGNIYFKLKDYDAAIKDYNQALNIHPSFALTYYYRGCVHVELGNAQKAIEDLGKAAKLFDKEKDADNYEETQRILKTIQPDYPEPSFIEMYTLCQCAEETGLEKTALERWIRAIHRKRQAILYGSPGTGKTYIAEKLAQHLIGGGNGFSELVQFHPAYSYEDFIQGIRPQSEDGKLTYPLVPGRFVQFCKEAENRQSICVFIIDEINRANLAQVFGELMLMYLLEYRDKEIPLAGGNKFRIPANVRIIGTMNTADRSIALVDYALRRRFAFIELRPNYDVLRQYHLKTGLVVEGLIQTLQRLNQTINDKNYEIGVSFFLTDHLSEDIEDIWRMEIEPYLEEYFFNQLEKVNEFRWEKVKQQLSL